MGVSTLLGGAIISIRTRISRNMVGEWPEFGSKAIANYQTGRVYKEAPNRLLFNSLTAIQGM